MLLTLLGTGCPKVDYKRYIYFYVNYLLKNKRVEEAKIIIENSINTLFFF